MPGISIVPKIKLSKTLSSVNNKKYYQNKLMLESNCKTKTFFETFKELSGKGKKSKSLNLSNGDAEHFNEYFANIGARLTQSKPNCMENNVIRQQHLLFLKKIDLIEVIEVIES